MNKLSNSFLSTFLYVAGTLAFTFSQVASAYAQGAMASSQPSSEQSIGDLQALESALSDVGFKLDEKKIENSKIVVGYSVWSSDTSGGGAPVGTHLSYKTTIDFKNPDSVKLVLESAINSKQLVTQSSENPIKDVTVNTSTMDDTGRRTNKLESFYQLAHREMLINLGSTTDLRALAKAAKTDPNSAVRLAFVSKIRAQTQEFARVTEQMLNEIFGAAQTDVMNKAKTELYETKVLFSIFLIGAFFASSFFLIVMLSQLETAPWPLFVFGLGLLLGGGYFIYLIGPNPSALPAGDRKLSIDLEIIRNQFKEIQSQLSQPFLN